MGFLGRPVDTFVLRPVEDRVLEFLGAAKTVLDLGCGRGEKTESFRRLGISAVGLDRSASRLARAREHWPECKFIQGTSERLPLADRSFDGVFSLSTLQYVDPQAAVGEVARVLRPGGRAVFIENLAGNPAARLYRALPRRYREGAQPRGHLSPGDLDALLGAFRSIEVQCYNLLTTGLVAASLIHESVSRAETIRWAPAGLYRRLSRADAGLLIRWPGLRRYCWTALICAEL